MTTGEKLKKARTLAGLTQKELSEKLKIPYQSVGQWERNVRKPKYETLRRLASALGVQVEDLIDDKTLDNSLMRPGINRLLFHLDSSIIFLKNGEVQHLIGLYGNGGKDTGKLLYELIDKASKLNRIGKQKAIERVQELAEIPRYTLQDEQKETPDDEQTKTPV